MIRFVICKEIGEPLGLILIGVVEVERLEVIGHIHKHLHLNLHRFDVAYVEQPIAVGSSIVGLLQLVVHQHGSRTWQPEIVVGRAEIRNVIIHAAMTLASLFFSIADAFHIAVVIVRPYDGDILRHLQSCVVDVEGLFVWYENLGK